MESMQDMPEPDFALTASERATLEEAGITRTEVNRLQHLLSSLDVQESRGLGPETRWALGRLTARADVGIQTLECINHILMRRLMPRGHWPVVRTPRTHDTRMTLFGWI